MGTLLAFLIPLTLIQGSLGETCTIGSDSEWQSALFGAGFSSPPERVDLPEGWGLIFIKDREIPLPLHQVKRVGLIEHEGIVGLIVLGNSASERLWSLDLIQGRVFPNSQIKEQISAAIESAALQSSTQPEREELQILNELLSGYSTHRSTYAFRLEEDIAFDAGWTEENIWTVMWNDSNGLLSVASWRIETGREEILRSIDLGSPNQTPIHPIQGVSDCVSQKESFDICRAITIPGVEVIAWPSEDENAAQ